MKITAKEAEAIYYGENEEWHEVKSEMVDKSRWSITTFCVYQKGDTDEYRGFYVDVPATEIQDGQDCFYGEVDFPRYEEVEVMVKKWRKVADPK